MFSDFTAIPTLPTADLDRAKGFYEETLGLTAGESQMGEELLYKCGDGGFLVYRSAYAGTNQATSMMFMVESGFAEEVSRLRDAGVSFDTFELEGLTWDDGVATMGEMKSVWFHDPDGNIINLMGTAG